MITSLRPIHVRAFSLAGASMLIVMGAFAQNGALDLTFSGDGQLGFMPQIPDVITVDILETGDRILPILSAVNGTTSSYIMRLHNDGSLDPGFDTDGILEFAGIRLNDAVLSLDESRILLLSDTVDAYRICAIDPDGVMVQPWTLVAAPYCPGFAKMLVDAQGRICIGKGASIGGAGYGQVIRLNEDFTTDNTFGTNGVAYTPETSFQYPLFEIDDLGRLVLASYGLGSSGIWRFNVDGTVDATFSYNLDLSSYSLDDWILDIAIAQDNGIYLQPNTWGWPAYLFKLLENGALDLSFGVNGRMDLSDTDPLYYTAPDELLIEPDGGLIILAQAYSADGYMSGKYLTRLDEFGVIDVTFDPGIQPIDDNGYDLRINFHCATLQDDGKVLSMDQVVKWQNGNLFGYAPLITRFHNEKGAVVASMNEAGPRTDGIIAYPNPTNGPAVLRIPGGRSQSATVTITDNAGAVVEQGRSVDERIDLSALPTGIYHCLVKHAGGSLHARILKQ